MPRIVEPMIGKVVGPLRMKVPASLVSSNDAEEHTWSYRSETTLNKSDRRGRPSRSRNNLKKRRSVSLPQSSISSVLLGKPPENDEPLHGSSPKTMAKTIKTRELDTCKSSQIRKSSGTKRTLDCDSPDNFANNSAGLKIANPITIMPTKRRALAFDTRCLAPMIIKLEEENCRQSPFIRLCKQLLRTLDARVAMPCILATTKSLGKGSVTRGNSALASLGIGIEAYTLVTGFDRTVLEKAIDLSDPTVISGSCVPTTGASGGALPIPIACQAKNSWLLFSSLVDSIIVEDSLCSGFVSSNELRKHRPPLAIVIVCSDASLFCDTNIHSHKDSLEVFLKHVTTYLDLGLLSAIDIVAAVSGEILLRFGKSDSREFTENDDLLCSHVEDSVFYQSNHAMAVQKCVHMIECTMSDWEGRCNTPWNLDAPARRGMHFNLSFSSIESTPVGFMEFSRTLMRDELVSKQAQLQLTCRLRSILLPQSTDGTQCSLSFEASYEIFPFSAGSSAALMLSRDMDFLSTMDFHVVKLIPLTCIDASLLFGMPMVVRAGFESDYAQFHEMKVLVRSLFQFLQVREQAMLLCGSSHADGRNKAAVSVPFTGKGLFHSDAPNSSAQYFVLMSQEIPHSMLVGGKKSNSGLLFRMAHEDFIIGQATNPSMNQISGCDIESENDEEMEAQHSELIESSLTSLEISVFNPMFDVVSGCGPVLYPDGKDEDMNSQESTVPNVGPNPFVTPQVENHVSPTWHPMDMSIYDLPSANNSDDENDDMAMA